MTRISSGIRAVELCDKHLNKERVEILRIPNAIKNGKAVVSGIPPDYRLGSGHVKFFYNKLEYLHKRYNELTEESNRRGFTNTDFSSAFDDLPKHLYNDWDETEASREITRVRVNDRLETMKKPIRYNKKEVELEDIKIYK